MQPEAGECADLVRVGALRRISKSLLPHTLHAVDSKAKSDAASELREMLASTSNAAEATLIQKELDQLKQVLLVTVGHREACTHLRILFTKLPNPTVFFFPLLLLTTGCSLHSISDIADVSMSAFLWSHCLIWTQHCTALMPNINDVWRTYGRSAIMPSAAKDTKGAAAWLGTG